MKIINYLINNKEVILIIILPILFFYRILLNPHISLYPAQDINAIYLPLKEFYIHNILHFKTIPLWDPYIFSGTPFLAYSETSIFYPFSIIFFIFPILKAFDYLFIINTLLAGLFTYYYCLAIRLDKQSSLISAIIFMFSGSLILLIYAGHTFVSSSIIWFPLLLLCYENIIQTKKLMYILPAIFALGCMLLTGYMQIVIYTLFVSTVYYYFRYFSESLKQRKILFSWKILLSPIIVIILSFCLAAIQILPSAELANLSSRSQGVSFQFASDFSLPPKQILAFVLPHFFGNETIYWGKGSFWTACAYTGILSLILTIVAIIYKRNKYTYFYIFLLFFSLLYALGNYSFIFPFFYKFIPFFDLFRVPARFLYFYSFSIAILAGIGLSHLKTLSLNNFNANRYLNTFLTFTIVMSLFIIYVFSAMNKNWFVYYDKYILKNSYGFGFDHRYFYNLFTSDLIIYACLITVISFMTIMIVNRKIDIKYIPLISVVIIITDLWLFGLPYIKVKKPSVSPVVNSLKYISRDKDQYRLLDLSGQTVSLTSSLHLQSVLGIDAAYLKSYQEFIWLIGSHYNIKYDSFIAVSAIENINIARLLNIKYILSEMQLKNNNLQYITHKNLYIYKINKSLPRAFSVPNAIIIQDKKIQNKYLLQESYDPKNIVILESKTNYPLINKTGFNVFTVNNKEPNKLIIKGNMDNPGYLFISEIWYPGWVAFDNGLKTNILKGNQIFRVLYLEKGHHEIIMTYDPMSYKIGKFVSLITLLILVSCIFITLKIELKRIKSKPNMNVNKKFIELNKKYYKNIENYDWVDVTDHYRGLESFFHKLREYLIKKQIAKYSKKGLILDAGCGTGLMLRHLPKGSIGIDINPRNIKKAKEHAPQAIVKLADIEKLPFKNAHFTTIICTEVIEHQPDPIPTVKELKRVLKKGGRLIGSVPSVSPVWFLRFLSSTCPHGEPFHKNFQKKELVDLFKEFKIISLKTSVLGMSLFFVLEKK